MADIVWTMPTYSAGRFLKSEVFELPFFTRSGKGSQPGATGQYVQKNALDEFAGVKPLWLHTNDGSSFHLTSAKGVKTLEDLKGLKIRAATRLNSRMLAALGATPVQMPLPAVPEAMAKGVIDGAMVPWEGVPAAKLQEIAKSHLDVPAGAAQVRQLDLRVRDEPGQVRQPAGRPEEGDRQQQRRRGLGLGRREGFDAWCGRTTSWPPIAATRCSCWRRRNWRAGPRPPPSIDDLWIKEVSAKGANGAALLEDARALIRQYDR